MTAAVAASKLDAAVTIFSAAAAASVAEIDRKKIKIYEKKIFSNRNNYYPSTFSYSCCCST
jgi:hypothetical protein